MLNTLNSKLVFLSRVWSIDLIYDKINSGNNLATKPKITNATLIFLYKKSNTDNPIIGLPVCST